MNKQTQPNQTKRHTKLKKQKNSVVADGNSFAVKLWLALLELPCMAKQTCSTVKTLYSTFSFTHWWQQQVLAWTPGATWGPVFCSKTLMDSGDQELNLPTSDDLATHEPQQHTYCLNHFKRGSIFFTTLYGAAVEVMSHAWKSANIKTDSGPELQTVSVSHLSSSVRYSKSFIIPGGSCWGRHLWQQRRSCQEVII